MSEDEGLRCPDDLYPAVRDGDVIRCTVCKAPWASLDPPRRASEWITDPDLPPEERYSLLYAVAHSMGPMHPDMAASIEAERKAIEGDLAAARKHIPAPPQVIGSATGLVYCKACGFLLHSASKGKTDRAGRPCTPVSIGLRTQRQIGSLDVTTPRGGIRYPGAGR